MYKDHETKPAKMGRLECTNLQLNLNMRVLKKSFAVCNESQKAQMKKERAELPQMDNRMNIFRQKKLLR